MQAFQRRQVSQPLQIAQHVAAQVEVLQAQESVESSGRIDTIVAQVELCEAVQSLEMLYLEISLCDRLRTPKLRKLPQISSMSSFEILRMGMAKLAVATGREAAEGKRDAESRLGRRFGIHGPNFRNKRDAMPRPTRERTFIASI